VPSHELEATILAAAHDVAGKPREAVLASRRLLKVTPRRHWRGSNSRPACLPSA
jgi:hypothetical protein